MELGWSLPKRKHFLKALVEQKSDRTHPVPFQGKTQDMPVFYVPAGLPLYRLENGRTTGLQAEYIATHAGTPEDFFRADGELEIAQRVQHQILVQLARGSKNLFREFEREKKLQTEPIILSSTGYVINGNRRLSTWRDLLESNPGTYKHFANVQAVVLPHADEKDLDRLEADLQLKEDLKADYSWTAKALMVKEKMDRFKYSEDEIASIYEISRKELRELLDSIEYAEYYLETRNKPRKFSELEKKEWGFLQICRTRPRTRASEADKELFERAAFCLIDESTEGKRIYAEIPKIASHLQEVKDALLTEMEFDKDGQSDEDLAIQLVETLQEGRNFDQARVVIRDAIEAESIKKRNRRRQDFVLLQVEKGRGYLAEAAAVMEPQSSTQGLTELLDQIDVHVKRIRDWVGANGK